MGTKLQCYLNMVDDPLEFVLEQLYNFYL